MKHIVFAALCLLCATLLLAALPTEAEARIYDDTLRLHVLAASDSDEDQSIKLMVRDRLLEVYGERLREASTLEEAAATVEALLPTVQEDVNAWLAAWGVPYGATVTLSREAYGTRFYDGFALPRGEYLSLRVLLHEGEGKNWWCVMYPPMCLTLSEGEERVQGYTDEQWRLIDGGGRTVKFKLLELLSDLLG